MGSRFAILLICTWLVSGCFTRRTEEVADPNAIDKDSAANGGMDAAADTGVNGEGGDNTGGDSGANANAGPDGGKVGCTKTCDTAAASRCDETSGKCAVCQQSKDCKALTTTPACKAGLGCFECTPGDEALCTANGKVCANDGNACVECNTPADCGDDKPVCSNHTCQKCTGAAEDCMGRSNAVCDVTSGSCVQCLAGKTAACNGKVCDMVGPTRVCSDKAPVSADLCNPCISDEQCLTGQLCVRMFGDNDGDSVKETDVGWFCQWEVAGGGAAPTICNSASRPFVTEQMGISSADKPDETANICTLATSTCPAHNAYRKFCGRYGAGAGSFIVEDISDTRLPDGTAGTQIAADHSECGSMGTCVAKSAANGAYRCSVACDNSNSDCPKGASICGGAPPTIAGICSAP